MIDELIRRYGKYMGGVDYQKILNDLQTEEERLREIERRLANVDTGKQIDNNKIQRLEIRQLLIKYVELKNQEKETLELIKDLKLRGYTKTEITKATKKLRKIRRQLRTIKRQIRALTTKDKNLKSDVFSD